MKHNFHMVNNHNYKKKTFRGYRYLFRPTKYGEREQARGEPRV